MSSIMAENTRKSIKNKWTEKHDEFCLKNKFYPSSKLLWQWLLRQGRLYTEIEPDLVEFNQWVKKHRGNGYCRVMLKKALEQLIESKAIDLVKRYTWRIVKLTTKPLSALKTKIKLRERKQNYDPQPSIVRTASPCTEQQQQYIIKRNYQVKRSLELLDQAGIYFDEEVLEVLNRPEHEIKVSIALFELAGSFEKITRAEGWIRTCLRERYWEHPSSYKLLMKHFGNTTFWNELFPDEFYELFTDYW